MLFEAESEATPSIVLDTSGNNRCMDSCFGVTVLEAEMDSLGVTNPLNVTVLSRLKIGCLE